MRSMKMRLVSAALATCMMASVLPTSAFALEPANATAGTSVSSQTENTAIQLHSGDMISNAGIYTMSGKYEQGVTINATGNVTIEIVGDVQLVSGRLLNVESVGTLTIKGNEHTVETTTEQATEILHTSSGMTGKVIVEGGTYKNEKGALGTEAKPEGMPFYFEGEGSTVILNHVTAIANGRVLQNWRSDITINGGNYTTVSPKYSTLFNSSVYGSLTLNEVTATTEGGNVVANYGQATINGGTYISKSASMAINAGTPTAGDSMKTYIHGGTFEGTGTVINNRGLMVIDEQVCETVIRVTGEQETAVRAGVRTQHGGNTIINKATIKNAQYGIWNRWAENDTQATSVTVGNVTFENTENDIRLEKDKTVTITDDLTGTVNISWDGESDASIITSDSTFSKDLKLVSANEDSVIAPNENGVYSAQKRAENCYLMDTENATATADLGNGTQTLYYYTQVPANTTTITLKAAKAPQGQRFARWELLNNNEDMAAKLFSDVALKEASTSFAMPEYDLLARAVFEPIPAEEQSLNLTDCTAKLSDGTEVASGTKVPVGTEVTVTFDKDFYADSNLVLSGWQVTPEDLTDTNGKLVKDITADSFTFVMPEAENGVTIEALTKTADTDDSSWDATTVVTGVAIGAGAAVLTYHIGTELYAEQVLGKGVAVPKTREDVALKAWELAGKPAVAIDGEPLSEAAQAEKWTVESGLMQNDAEGSFNGQKKMNKLKALRVLDAAKKLG